MSDDRVLFQIDQVATIHEDADETGVAAELRKTTKSLWKATSFEEEAHTMKAEELPAKIPVLVIGGGLAGILTAYQLKEQGIDSIVVERSSIGNGATANTTAKITSLHGAVYQKIAKAYGPQKAIQYYESQQNAIEEYAKIIEKHHINCEFVRKNHIMYTEKEQEKLQKEFECIKQLGIPAQWVEHSPLPFSISGGIVFSDQAQFHPLQFLREISEGLQVFTHCQATRIDFDGTVEINHHYKVKADAVVIATHYPIINSKGFYFTRLDQERSYAVALKQPGGTDIHDMYIDMEEKGHSFRPYKDMLIMVVGNHRSGKKKVPDYYKQLEGEAFQWFPNAKIEYHWSNQDCMSVDHIPYIGSYSKSLPNIYVATGFNQWGMSGSMVAAKVISDLIAKGSNEYEELYSPSRHQISGTGSFIANGAISAVNLMKQLLHVKGSELDQIRAGTAGIVKLDGMTAGVYRDENGELHAVDTKCPHLGCQLQFNNNDKTWDCPCHGSRFDVDGHLIEAPAQKDLDSACCKVLKK